MPLLSSITIVQTMTAESTGDKNSETEKKNPPPVDWDPKDTDMWDSKCTDEELKVFLGDTRIVDQNHVSAGNVLKEYFEGAGASRPSIRDVIRFFSKRSSPLSCWTSYSIQGQQSGAVQASLSKMKSLYEFLEQAVSTGMDVKPLNQYWESDLWTRADGAFIQFSVRCVSASLALVYFNLNFYITSLSGTVLLSSVATSDSTQKQHNLKKSAEGVSVVELEKWLELLCSSLVCNMKGNISGKRRIAALKEFFRQGKSQFLNRSTQAKSNARKRKGRSPEGWYLS